MGQELPPTVLPDNAFVAAVKRGFRVVDKPTFIQRKGGDDGKTFVQLRTAMGPSEEFSVDDLLTGMDDDQLSHLVREVNAVRRRREQNNPYVMAGGRYIRFIASERVDVNDVCFASGQAEDRVYRQLFTPAKAADWANTQEIDEALRVALDPKTQVSAQNADECPRGGTHERVQMIFSSYCKKCNCNLA